MTIDIDNTNRNELLLPALTKIVNAAETESNDVIIAKAFIELRSELDQWTQDDIAKKYYVSQASISRFIHKLGYRSFNELKSAMHQSSGLISKAYSSPTRDFETASTEIWESLKPIADAIREIDRKALSKALKLIENHKTIYIVGSELSMAITRLLQMKLIGLGKNVYTLYNNTYQSEIIHAIGEDDLVIVISMGQRWYKLQWKDQLKKISSQSKMLWTVQANHEDLKLFDTVVRMGETDNPDLGYHYLMQFELLIYQML